MIPVLPSFDPSLIFLFQLLISPMHPTMIFLLFLPYHPCHFYFVFIEDQKHIGQFCFCRRYTLETRYVYNLLIAEVMYRAVHCQQRLLGKHAPFGYINPFMPTGAFNICCPRDCVSRHNGGTRGAPIMPRDAVSRTANVERTGRHK